MDTRHYRNRLQQKLEAELKPSRSWIALIFLLSLFTFGSGILSHYLTRRLDHQLRSGLSDYGRLDYEDLDIRVLPPSLTLKNAVFQSDSNKAEIPFFRLKIAKVRLSGLRSWPWNLKQHIALLQCRLEHPTLTIYRSAREQRSAKPPSKEFLPAISLGRLEIRQGQVHWLEEQDSSARRLRADSFHLWLNNLTIKERNDLMEPQFRQAGLELQRLVITDKRRLYQYQLRGIQLHSKDSLLYARSIALRPLKGQEDFFQQLAHKHDYRRGQFDGLSISGLDVSGLLAKRSFQARLATLDSARIFIVSNKNLPVDPEKQKLMPSEMLQKLPFSLHLDSLHLKRGQLHFMEIPEKSPKAGQIFFSDLALSLRQLSNDSSRIAKDPELDIQASGYFMGKAKVSAGWQFALRQPRQTFRFQGNIAPMSMKLFNPMMAPLARFRFETGQLLELRFDGKGDGQQAAGDLDMWYEDLNIQLLDKDLQPGRKFLGFVMDRFLIEETNHPREEKYRKGRMHTERDPSRSFIHYWWKAIHSGMQSVLLPNLVLPEEREHEKIKE